MRKFEKGDEVLFTSGGFARVVEKTTITRVTATLACIEIRGREMKFSRANGYERSQYSRSSIEHPTPEGEARWQRSQRREVARKLGYAASKYSQGDEGYEPQIRALFAEWDGYTKAARP